jgi:hypothetical protein
VTYVQQTAGTGNLGITITGLPGDANASVTVTGPGGYNQSATSSRTMTNLAPGSYTVTARSVSGSGSTYTPLPATQTATVTAGTTATAGVRYGAPSAPGNLQVNVSGLPSGANAAVMVTGPDSYSQGVGSTTSLSGVVPGDYTITAASVVSGGNTYVPNPLSQIRRVSSNAITTAAVAYVQQTPNTGSLFVSITGVPDDASANVTVMGPNNFSQNVTGSSTLVNLSPGTYTISANAVSGRDNSYLASPTSQTKTVSIGTTARADINYTSSP